MMVSCRVRVPATSANLGPGFDCLGLALDLWNEAEFNLSGEDIRVSVDGLGADCLPRDATNLVAVAAVKAMQALGKPAPHGLAIHCTNRIPPGSGLGSSAAAAVAGLLGGNALAGGGLSQERLLGLATELEGHPDNAAAALYGGLTLSACLDGEVTARRVSVAPLQTVVVLPVFSLSTTDARAALPTQVSRADAVFNIGRTALVIEALRSGDLDLLGKAMDDRLHQPYRFGLIPGAAKAAAAARTAGASAVALSGAGPSLIAFGKDGLESVAQAMAEAFSAAGLSSSRFFLPVSDRGAEVEA
jgi:homoserine kinase